MTPARSTHSFMSSGQGAVVVDIAGAADAFAGLADALLQDIGRMDFLRQLRRGCAQLVQGCSTLVYTLSLCQ
ncbi:MAG: hypothetical protein EON55_25645 [Alphaproteobacteria bacterium]|nr:MAG: hypothetical protein EON55_25645 [Alphaproteobacteria bacterium]